MLTRIDPVDYLIIGHLTQDILPNGLKLGGTAAYASRTALALGARVGIVTSTASSLQTPELQGISIHNYPAEFTSTFENISIPHGRIQYIHYKAEELHENMVPTTWRSAPIVHIAPIANEVNPHLASAFPNSFVGVTPQGFMRSWDGDHRVHFRDWLEAPLVLNHASAVVFSIEDVENDESRIESMLPYTRVMVVTEGAAGCRVYWNGDVRTIRPPQVEEVESTGAGDIFAASFFIRLQSTRDPWEAARFATQVAARSVTRRGMESTPTREEMLDFLIEVTPRIEP
ncbi:MAG TPA: PfkB family carbohydrate kinase [Anaerolineaceae bacterium]|nr:PfkB family carbohydrate kinase [Anaerolineaceae bacterium]